MSSNNNKNDKKDFEDVFDDIKDGFGDMKDGLIDEINSVKDDTTNYTVEDIEENKVMGGLCYLLLLWLIPFFMKKDSPYVQFHLNQGLLAFIVWAVAIVAVKLVGWIPLVGWILSIICGVIAAAIILIGAYNGFTGKAKELPFIGKIKLLSF